jgi:hypothetical protein
MAQDIGFGGKWFRFPRYDLRPNAWLKKHLNSIYGARMSGSADGHPGIIKCIYGIAG